MDANASPLNPYVAIRDKSENVESFEVVNLSAKMGRSLLRIPHPLSWICRSFMPPSLTMTRIDVAPASRLFSRSSFSAEAGLCIISPAAMRFMRDSWRRRMGRGSTEEEDMIVGNRFQFDPNYVLVI